MSEREDLPGLEIQTPGSGSERSLVPRDELNRVVQQRDRFKEELRATRSLRDEVEQANRQLHGRLERELEDKTLSQQQRQELEVKVREIENKYFTDKELLERELQETKNRLHASEKRVSSFMEEKVKSEQENAFIKAARQANFSHDNAELLLGYLRGRGRLLTHMDYEDEAKTKVRAFRHEVECQVTEDGSTVNKALPLDEAMALLKLEKKNLAPGMAAGGGNGSQGSDGGASSPGALNRKTMTVQQYREARKKSADGKVWVY